jgi:uncharacterized SAM-binding protein YcdF (DUF218 family)
MREILSYSFLMPPTIFILTGLSGGMLALRRPRLGIRVALASNILIYLLATPVASKFLLHLLVEPTPAHVDLTTAQAIVIFSADIRVDGRDDGFSGVGLLTLDRLAAAARLYRRLHLPIVVSGGRVPHLGVSAAKLMRDELEQNFLVPVTFSEEISHTTYENAAYTSHFLITNGYNTVILVSQRRDLRRALWSFSRFGIRTLPYSTDDLSDELRVGDFFPSAQSFGESYYILHEIFGLVYYKLFY